MFDVQVKRPGSGVYVNWKTGVALKKATFTPDAGTGAYSFHARIRRTANGAASGYSGAQTIRVS